VSTVSGILVASTTDPSLEQVLAFERRTAGFALAAKQRAVRRQLGLSVVRYHQLLHRALDLPEALVWDPVLVRRLRRLREARRRRRQVRRLGSGASCR